MRSIKETTELLLEIEERFPVDRLCYRGVEVWPLLRFCFLQSINGLEKKTPPSLLERLRKRRSEPFPVAWKVDRQVEKSAGRLSSDSEFVFFEWRSFVTGGETEAPIHRFFDLIRDEAGKRRVLGTIRWENVPGAPPLPGAEDYVINELLSGVRAELDRASVPHRPASWLVSRIIAHWNRQENVARVAVGGFLRECEVVHRLAQALDRILPRETRVVFLCCFYNVTAFAMSLACARRGIRCVEVQHGQQGDWHPMYTHWSRVPDHGYATIPSFFWMWNEEAACRIDSWGAAKGVVTVVGGNPWLIRQIERGAGRERSGNEARATYLVSLQNFELPEFLWAAIEALPDSRWIFRVHPRHPAIGVSTRNRCEEMLPRNRYEIQEGEAVDIYEVFPEVDFQLTGWSTTAYEALWFQVPTVLVHKNGQEAMAADIASGRFFYADNERDLVKVLSNPRTQAHLDSPYRNERGVVVEALTTIDAPHSPLCSHS